MCARRPIVCGKPVQYFGSLVSKTAMARLAKPVSDRFGHWRAGARYLCRGANEVWLVERSLTVQRLIKRNFAVTGQDHLPSGLHWGRRLLGLGNASLRRPFDVIFCDPPYGFTDWEAPLTGSTWPIGCKGTC